ncbi:MAG: hypothetical protein ABFC94_18880 [Syntrophomonas sp.]
MIYRFKLAIAFPTNNFNNYKNLENEINSAIKLFNSKYKGQKQISLINIDEKNITVDLETNLPAKYPTREISALSRILKNDFKWNQYSQFENRLFNVDMINKEESLSNNTVINRNLYNLLIPMYEEVLITKDEKVIENYINFSKKLLALSEAKKTIIEAEKICSEGKANK